MARQHSVALDVFGRITAADRALAARVATFESVTEHRQWLQTPEGEASLEVLEEVYAFCRASQDEYDATGSREPLQEVPWVPPQMKEIVRVAFGCPSQQRRLSRAVFRCADAEASRVGRVACPG